MAGILSKRAASVQDAAPVHAVSEAAPVRDRGAPGPCACCRRPYYTRRVGTYTLAAAAAFGLESVVCSELAALGYADVSVNNGHVSFNGTAEDIARCSLWLRSADRLLIRLAEFDVSGSDDLYEGVRSIPWRDFLPLTARLVVNAKTVHARRGASGKPGASGSPPGPPLPGVPAIQSMGKKAIVDCLLGGKPGRLEESGPLYPVLISVAGGKASVALDASGAGLHKRGYRTEAGEAPLKESLAAGMVLLSRWDASRPFADPMCGSGTIAIEAALIAANAAPGLSRRFAAEDWPHIPAETWSRARGAAAAERRETRPKIVASDRDPAVLAVAKRNARRAGVGDSVEFRAVDLSHVRLDGEYGCIVTNPPYAERLGNDREAAAVYRDLGRLFRSLPSWSLFALCAHPDFQRLFGLKATKNRKLYNGNILCYLDQYFGPLPPAGGAEASP
jgi:putative N6-adenine-specific DNA methylase